MSRLSFGSTGIYPRASATSTPAGLYLHLPFCSAICPYCDFSVLVGGADKRSRFVAALIREITAAAAELAAALRSPDTVYLGGGTPSLLEAEDLEWILAAVRRGFSTPAETRVFLEANPEDIDAASVAAWRRLGVEFLSLGVQSFDDRDLELLGRRHTAAEARRAVELAVGAGFETVSVDLIYGLPHHHAAGWRRTLETAVELGPDHLSCYELEIHPRTVFGKRHARGQLAELPDERQAELFVLTHRLLAERGYKGYEVSNFSRSDDHQSRHNRKYWRHVPYLGLGPSAHSFDGRRRWWNERSTPRWEKRVLAGEPAVAGSEELSDEDLALETLMLGLRTAAGVDLEAFRERFGYDLVEGNRRVVDAAVARGLLRTPSGRLAATVEGLAVADGLAASFEVGPG